MDKATFDMINKFKEIENDIYFKLCEKGIDSSEVDDILNDSVEYREQLLRLGKHAVEEEYLDKETFIQESYEGIERYIKLYVIYEYDNGMALCETTSGLNYLVPQQLLACYNEEENTDDEEIDEYEDDEEKEAEILISKLEVDSEYVVSYLDLKIDKFKHLFFDSKEKAVAVYKEVKANKDCMSEMIQSKKEYEKDELGID